MRKAAIVLYLFYFLTSSYSQVKEYKKWENSEAIFNYGTFLDLSYGYSGTSNISLEVGSLNLPLLSLLIPNDYFFIGTSLYSLDLNNQTITNSFLPINIFIKVFNIKRYWSIPSKLIGGHDRVFDFIYFKYFPLNHSHSFLNNTDNSDTFIKIGNETGVLSKWGSVILGINYTYNLESLDDSFSCSIHYRLGGPMQFVPR